jgi:hypothetical protein
MSPTASLRLEVPAACSWGLSKHVAWRGPFLKARTDRAPTEALTKITCRQANPTTNMANIPAEVRKSQEYACP